MESMGWCKMSGNAELKLERKMNIGIAIVFFLLFIVGVNCSRQIYDDIRFSCISYSTPEGLAFSGMFLILFGLLCFKYYKGDFIKAEERLL